VLERGLNVSRLGKAIFAGFCEHGNEHFGPTRHGVMTQLAERLLCTSKLLLAQN